MLNGSSEKALRYPELPSRRLSGDEALTAGGRATRLHVLDFWRWSASMLTDNTLRGTLAEFLVASTLGQAQSVRREWDPFDLITKDGTKVEVKSAARWQSWAQSTPSPISFVIAPTRAWDTATGSFRGERRRQADVYVFALVDADSKSELDPLELGQWRFFVLPTSVLDAHCGEQKRVSLARLRALGADECGLETLADTIGRAGETQMEGGTY
jgi:hypothetical protein